MSNVCNAEAQGAVGIIIQSAAGMDSIPPANYGLETTQIHPSMTTFEDGEAWWESSLGRPPPSH